MTFSDVLLVRRCECCESTVYALVLNVCVFCFVELLFVELLLYVGRDAENCGPRVPVVSPYLWRHHQTPPPYHGDVRMLAQTEGGC